MSDSPTVDDLLAQYEADADSLGPTGRSLLIRLLATAWRAKTAAHSSLLYDHQYLKGYVDELEKERDLLRGQRDRAEEKLADAYAEVEAMRQLNIHQADRVSGLHLDALAGVIDAAHLERQRAWSAETFGPGRRTLGILDHIRKELVEIEADPTDLGEWVDVVILALDGAWRAGWEPQQVIDAIHEKQAVNEAREWPDWRTGTEDEAIEHDRAAEARAAAPAPEELAQRFHETYERLAPEFGYETRPESAVAWDDVPDDNRALMVAVCAEIQPELVRAAAPQPLMTVRGKFIHFDPPEDLFAVYRADQTPGVTREQVAQAAAQAIGETYTPGERNPLADYEVVTDAVWALLTGEGTADG